MVRRGVYAFCCAYIASSRCACAIMLADDGPACAACADGCSPPAECECGTPWAAATQVQTHGMAAPHSLPGCIGSGRTRREARQCAARFYAGEVEARASARPPIAARCGRLPSGLPAAAASSFVSRSTHSAWTASCAQRTPREGVGARLARSPDEECFGCGTCDPIPAQMRPERVRRAPNVGTSAVRVRTIAATSGAWHAAAYGMIHAH